MEDIDINPIDIDINPIDINPIDMNQINMLYDPSIDYPDECKEPRISDYPKAVATIYASQNEIKNVMSETAELVYPKIPIQPNPNDPIIEGEQINENENMIQVRYKDVKGRECITWEFKSKIRKLQNKIGELGTQTLNKANCEGKRVNIPHGGTIVYAKIIEYDGENKRYRVSLENEESEDSIYVSIPEKEVEENNTPAIIIE